MAIFSIYSKDGSIVRYSGYPKYTGSFMNPSYIEFASIESPTPIEWQVGDYVDYYRTGFRYKLYSLPEPKKQARRLEAGNSFVYSNVKFYAATKELEIAPFRDLVPDDNEIHFSTRPDVSTYENVYGIAGRLQECMNNIYPDKWIVQVFDTTDADLLALFEETKEFSVSNGSCLDALSQIYESWKNVGWIHTYDSSSDKNIITIGRSSLRDADNTSDAYAYGKGNGLTSIKKAAANEGEFATRLYVYGSERNIQTRYYNGKNIHDKDSVNIVNLMLPLSTWGTTDGLPDARKAYLQADDSIIEKYGLIPRTVYFDGSENEEIYPSIIGLTMAQVRQAMIDAGEGDSEYLPGNYNYRIDEIGLLHSTLDSGSKEDTEANRTFRVSLREMGFNIAEQGKLTEEGFATISMKSGACAGREFKVRKYSHEAYGNEGYGRRVYELEKNWDESLGMGFPNTLYPIKSGDQFVILDIPMPEFYITLASKRLLDAGQKMLADYTRVSAFYEPSIDSIKIKEGGKLLREGMYMQVVDADIIDTENNTDYVLIDTLSIDESPALPSYKVTLREQKRSARTFGTLEDMIEDVKVTSKQEIDRARQYTDRRFRSAQETLTMLQSAFDNFSEGINPVTVQTIALLVGDESLQFKFTESTSSLEDVACPLTFDPTTKQMVGGPASLIHMTLDIDSVTAPNARSASDYRGWDIPAFYSAILEDADKSYYVYAKASASDSTAEFLLSETPIGMSEVTGYYHFLVGVLNKEYEGTRDFVTLYGFTEVLPGQITTDVIRSADGKTYFDLANSTISGNIKFINSAGSSVDMSDYADDIETRVSDMEYLQDTFAKGETSISGGVVMTQMVAVGEGGDDIEAFLNGSTIAEDTDNHGKLILAGGIPTETEDGSTDLAARANEASTRIYEDGTTYTNSLILEEGCTVGAFEVDTYGNLSLDGCSKGTGTSTYVYTDGFAVAGVKSENMACYVLRRLRISAAEDADAFIVIEDDRGEAIRVVKGMFAGLRPKSRTINSSTSSSLRHLTEFDHTIFMNGNITVYLPSSPLEGQEYVILTSAGGTLNGNGKKIFLFANGSDFSSLVLSDLGSSRVELRLYWHKAEGKWWAQHTAHNW